MERKLKSLKAYKEILLLCRKIQVINELDNKIENRIPTYGLNKEKEKQKILTLY